MKEITVQCKGILAGKAAGPALVLHEPIGFYGDIDESGYIVAAENQHAPHLQSGRPTGKKENLVTLLFSYNIYP